MLPPERADEVAELEAACEMKRGLGGSGAKRECWGERGGASRPRILQALEEIFWEEMDDPLEA
jgi:hypothetical protein